MIPAVLLCCSTTGMWLLWVYGGDGQRFYTAMGWTHPWIVGRPKHRRVHPSQVK